MSFGAAIAAMFRDRHMSRAAFYRAGGTGDGIPVRIIVRTPDVVADYSGSRLSVATVTVDMRVADVPAPAQGDTFVAGADTFRINGAPQRDSEGLCWNCEAVRA